MLFSDDSSSSSDQDWFEYVGEQKTINYQNPANGKYYKVKVPNDGEDQTNDLLAFLQLDDNSSNAYEIFKASFQTITSHRPVVQKS